MEEVKQNKQMLLYGGGLFTLIVVITIVMAIMKVNPKRERELPSGKETEIKRVAKETNESEEKFSNESAESDASTTADIIERDLELKKSLDRLQTTDRELNERWDLPEDILSETPTDKLFLHFLKSPMKAHIMIYTGENEKIGVQRLINSSGIVHELYMRDDLAEGALKMYREYNFSPESISDESIIEKHSKLLDDPARREMLDPNNIVYLKIAKICLDIMYADKTLLSPQFFPKLKGYEREFLQVMLERYEITYRMDELYAVGDNDYALARACLPTFCLKLAENLDQEFYNKLKEIEYPNGSGNEQFIEEIKNYLKIKPN